MSAYAFIFGMLWIGSTPVMAQNTVTLPSKGIHPRSGGVGFIVPSKNWLPSRQQCLYTTKDLPARPIAIREVAFQPKIRSRWVPGFDATAVTLTLDLSFSPIQPYKRSLTFAKNHGKTITRVFSGTIQLPRITWQTKPDWYFRIPFRRRFIASPKLGTSLVLDFATSSVVTKMNSRYGLIQKVQDKGYFDYEGNGYNCHFQKWNFLGQVFFGDGMFPGSRWSWSAGPLLAKQPGFLAIGDAGRGSKWGGQPLPFDLKALGAPGCTWSLRPVLFFPFVVDALNQGSSMGHRIPKDARLVHARIYMQGAYAWPKANALGWLFLPAFRWRIGSNEDHGATALGVGKDLQRSKVAKWWFRDHPVPWCRITY